METTLENPHLTVRSATPNEVPMMLSFITRKAQFDREMGSFTGTLQTSEDKIRDSLFGPKPFAYFLVAELAGQPVGFALYYFRYSSFAGQPSLWLDDLIRRCRQEESGSRSSPNGSVGADCQRKSVNPHCVDGGYAERTRAEVLPALRGHSHGAEGQRLLFDVDARR